MAVRPAVALAVPTLALQDDEDRLVRFHLERLSSFQRRNKKKEAYYEGTQRLARLSLSVPPALQDVRTIVGWPGLAVDVLEERLQFLGWTSDAGDDPLGLGDVFRANGLDADAPMGHLDSLIAGTAFVIVGSADEGEPQPLVTVESPSNVTGEWDGRVRRLSSALSIDEVDDDNQVRSITLYTPNEDVRMGRPRRGAWKIIDRDAHGFGRVKVARLVNRPRSSQADGRSEITRPLRAYTDQGVRTLLGMEVNREFYSAPQRYVLGAPEGAFEDEDGNTRTGWETVMGRVLGLPYNEDDDAMPQVGQFEAASPAPYLDQIRGLSELVASEAGIPATYLGFATENPPSADAIRALESRLIKRAERRQATFGRAWREVAALALLVREGSLPAEFDSVDVKWRDPATPTRSAAADEATKLVGAGVLLPDSQVTYDRIGLSPTEQRILRSEKRKAEAVALAQGLAAAARGVNPNEEAPNDASNGGGSEPVPANAE